MIKTPPPIVRLAELEVDPSKLDVYKTALRQEIEVSLHAEPGVLALNAVSIKGKPASVRLMEVYADEAAYEAHIHSPHFLKYKMQVAGMVRSLTLLETDIIQLGQRF